MLIQNEDRRTRVALLDSSAVRAWTFAMGIVLSACGQEHKDDDPAATASPADSTAPVVTMVFECGGEYGFVTRIQDSTAWLFLPEGTVALTQVSVSETSYEGYGLEFVRQGEAAYLRYGDNRTRRCENNQRRAIWEHAKLNGVHFRAVGNEPGWILEIETERMVLVVGYGQERHEFELPDPSVDESTGITVYETTDGANHLTVKIEGRECTDTMSGESFEATVSVVLNDVLLRGCGRALH